ncbi:MAG: carotenoid 1,2-hydratase [Gemmatimonadota bacterium]|nr:MAG: carotenoid 1,2-hydratase [Gemmatimonadota bacterium]
MLTTSATQADRANGQEWRYAEPDFAWQFPRDHWAHSGYKTEWWYFTGQLTDVADSTRRFGYQFTFFRVGIAPDSLPINSTWAVTDLVMGHAAVTDLTTGEHRFSELIYRANGLLGDFPPPGDTLVAWSRAPAGTDATWHLSWRGDGFDFTARDDRTGITFDLRTTPKKSLVFQGPNGYSRKGNSSSAASQYYSFTRMATSGALGFDGREYVVTGESWMDKEFGSNQLTENQAGWDWFSLRLDDGRDVMLYLLRDRDGSIDYARATIVTAESTARYLSADQWVVEVLDTWRSPATEAEYPVSWRIEAPEEGLSLFVTAEFAQQENVSRLIPSLFYWEGAVNVADAAGRRLGIGYVELTGYGTAAPPVI